MVALANGLQTRILKAAEEHLGPQAEEFVHDICRERLETPFEALEYSQLNALIKAIEQAAGPILGRRAADSLAESLLQLHADIEAGLSGRLIGSVARVLGPAAEPFMRNVCGRLNVPLDGIHKSDLPAIAREASAEALPLLGAETAEALEHVIERAASARPAGMVPGIVAAATEFIGPAGERFVRDLCRTRLEVELDEVEPEALDLLADAIRGEAAELIGSTGAAAFAQAVSAALVSPNVALRARIVQTARSYIGPAAEDFMRRSCRKAGMPWEAVDIDHMMWLAEVVRAESAGLIGKKQADDFARTLRAFLTGK